MKPLPAYLCFLILLIIYPTNTPIIAQEELDNQSFWLFSTGNETINEYRQIKLADGSNYNASISEVAKKINNSVTNYNISTDYYYTDDGFILGANMVGKEHIAPNDQYPNGLSINYIKSSQRFSNLNRSDHVAKRIIEDEWYTSEFNLTRNITRTYSYEYFPTIKYKLSNGEIVDAIPFNITSNLRSSIGIVTLEYFDRLQIINQSNGNYNVTDIYNNGTIINNIKLLSNTVAVYFGYYVPKLFKAIDLSVTVYGISDNSLSLSSLGSINTDIKVNSDHSDPLGNKILLDYYIDLDFYNINDIPTETSSDLPSETTTTSTSSIKEETTISNNVIDTNFTEPLENDGKSKLSLGFSIFISNLVLLVFYRNYCTKT